MLVSFLFFFIISFLKTSTYFYCPQICYVGQINKYEIIIKLKKFKFETKMQNNSLAQIKLRANEFIEDYERQVTERQYQKQKLKQNIMLEIMSNRHKSQTSQFGGQEASRIQSIRPDNKLKGSALGTVSEQGSSKNEKNNYFQYTRSNSVPNAFKNSQSDENQEVRSPQITFKIPKSKDPYPPQYSSKKDSDKKNNSQFIDEQNYQINQALKGPRNKSKVINQIYEKSIGGSKLSQRDSQQQIKSDKYQKYKPIQSYNKPQEDDPENIQEDFEQPEQKGAIFLTMDEEQSMEVFQEQKKKNYTFDIVMDKSQPIQDIDELKKRKIEELEKKRQQRMEQFKKQEDGKEKRTSTHFRNGPQPQIPKSKSKKRIQPPEREVKANLSSNISQQSHYNIRPPQQPQRGSYYISNASNQRENPANQYLPTPKTVTSQYRNNDKSKGKSNIFRESPKRNEKSASKYAQQPKIQPKERKNTFVKQSNKKLMITAITNVCLPGELNRKQREKLIDVIESQQSEFFVFLFKQYTRKVIKAIYILDPSQTFLQKIYGEKAPQQIIAENVQSFYRFDSGSRQFKKLDGCKSFSLVVHAIDLA